MIYYFNPMINSFNEIEDNQRMKLYLENIYIDIRGAYEDR